MTQEELLQNSLKQVKQEFTMFLSEYKKMRDAQFRERRAQGDTKICVKEYSNIFYYQYLAEKSADEMFHKLSQKYSI